jgi:hypothetical protein
VAPATLSERSRSNRFLSLVKRQRIATLHRQGLGVRAIAAAIGEPRPRSAASCAATSLHTTAVATTVISRPAVVLDFFREVPDHAAKLAD